MKNNTQNILSVLWKKPPFLFMSVFLITVIIIMGGFLYAEKKGKEVSPFGDELARKVLFSPPTSIKNMRPVSADDHIYGNPNAEVIAVEYTDLECPFCKKNHFRMKQIVNDSNGRIAWVYRHHPLDNLHSKARKEGEAAECASELGGNKKFWEYVDGIFSITPSNNGLDLSLLPEIAENIGLDRNAFEECLESGKYAEKIEFDFLEAEDTGLYKTPSMGIIQSGGVLGFGEKRFVIIGAQRMSTLRQFFSIILGDNKEEEVFLNLEEGQSSLQ